MNFDRCIIFPDKIMSITDIIKGNKPSGEGYFADYISEFSDLAKCKYESLENIIVDSDRCFYTHGYSYRYFLSEKYVDKRTTSIYMIKCNRGYLVSNGKEFSQTPDFSCLYFLTESEALNFISNYGISNDKFEIKRLKLTIEE